jgi:UDP-sugar transporter A1/2/3
MTIVAIVLTAALALQFAAQPILAKRFIHVSVNKTSTVLVGEVIKGIVSAVICWVWYRKEVWDGVSIQSSIRAAAIPACLYSVQNWMVQTAYQNIDSLTFNMLNQSKILFSAICVYWICGRKQSKIQFFALCLLCIAGVILNFDSRKSNSSNSLYWGIVPVLIASVLSGLCAAITEVALRKKKRNSYFLTLELSIYSIMVLIWSSFSGPDAVFIQEKGMFFGWDAYTFIPILSQAFGGIIVGLITKFAGSEMKGFALISGLLFTAYLESIFGSSALKETHYLALAIVVISIYLHTSYPYLEKQKTL